MRGVYLITECTRDVIYAVNLNGHPMHGAPRESLSFSDAQLVSCARDAGMEIKIRQGGPVELRKNTVACCVVECGGGMLGRPTNEGGL